MCTKQVVYDRETGDYTLYLDDQFVGYARTDTEGQTTLAMLITERLRHGTCPCQPAPQPDAPVHDAADAADDPLLPYSGTPFPDVAVDAGILQGAHAYFVAWYDDHGDAGVRAGADKALDLLTTNDWVVLPDGTLDIVGSRGARYLVTNEGCMVKGKPGTWCPSFLFHQRSHGGQCKHLIARELVRLAQVMAGSTA
jgi:hypothetical protein